MSSRRLTTIAPILHDRRTFLKLAGTGLAATAFGLPLASCATSPRKGGAAAPAVTGIRHYNTLGRTGLKVSDIGIGSGYIADPAVIEYALDKGINYFDTAETYGQGRSEEAIGQVAAANRDRMVICTKLVMDGNVKEAEIMTRLDGSLERLRTDYVDILMVHTGNQDALDNPEIRTAFDKLKEAGKIHFTGVSHHGPNMTAELRPLIEEDRFDVMLCAFDPVEYADLDAFFKAADDKGIGIVAMKVLTSARKAELEEFVSGRYPFHQAALRWCLENPYVDCVIPSVRIMDQIDEFVVASGAGAE